MSQRKTQEIKIMERAGMIEDKIKEKNGKESIEVGRCSRKGFKRDFSRFSLHRKTEEGGLGYIREFSRGTREVVETNKQRFKDV